MRTWFHIREWEVIDLVLALLIIAAVVLVVGCVLLIADGVGAKPVEYGTANVVGKYYDDPDTWYRPQLIGKTTVLMQEHDPEHWNIQLDSDTCKEAETSESVYDELESGEYAKYSYQMGWFSDVAWFCKVVE